MAPQVPEDQRNTVSQILLMDASQISTLPTENKDTVRSFRDMYLEEKDLKRRGPAALAEKAAQKKKKLTPEEEEAKERERIMAPLLKMHEEFQNMHTWDLRQSKAAWDALEATRIAEERQAAAEDAERRGANVAAAMVDVGSAGRGIDRAPSRRPRCRGSHARWRRRRGGSRRRRDAGYSEARVPRGRPRSRIGGYGSRRRKRFAATPRPRPGCGLPDAAHVIEHGRRLSKVACSVCGVQTDGAAFKQTAPPRRRRRDVSPEVGRRRSTRPRTRKRPPRGKSRPRSASR